MDYKKNNSQRYPTFFTEEDIEGHIELKLKKPKFEHNGIRAELHGVIEKYNKINSTITEFTNLGIEILRPGVIQELSSEIPFSFKNTKLQYESYKVVYVQVKYFIKIIINANVLTYTYEQEFAAVNPKDDGILMENDENIKMSLGIRNLLSLDFELEHNNYNCRGTVKGLVSFNYIHLPIKYIEVQLLKHEKVFVDNKREEPTLIESVELMDGSPTKNTVIPFRIFLKSYNLTPTYKNVHSIFNLRYYVNLIIGDFENNTFFKQAEIQLFRVFKTKKNPELNYGPWEEFISEPIYNEEYYKDELKKNDDVKDNKNNNNKINLNIFGNNEEEEDEEFEEEDDDEESNENDDDDDEEKLEDDEFIISTTSEEKKKKEEKKNKKNKKSKNKKFNIVNILRSNSLYKKEHNVNNNINKNKINIENNNINNNNININIPFNDDEENDPYINKVIYSNFPVNSNNNLFNDENNNEINTSSNNNNSYNGRNIKFDD